MAWRLDFEETGGLFVEEKAYVYVNLAIWTLRLLVIFLRSGGSGSGETGGGRLLMHVVNYFVEEKAYVDW